MTAESAIVVQKGKPARQGPSAILAHLGAARLDCYDSLLTAMIVTDEKGVVRHLSPSARALLGALEPLIQVGQPDFAVETLQGRTLRLAEREDIDPTLHLAKKGDPVGVVYALGKASLGVRMNPVHAPDGSLLGHVSELWDATPEARSRRQVERLLADLEHMATSHMAGTVDHYLDPSRFDGAFAGVADKVNGMVRGHIQNGAAILDLMQQFSTGRFDAPFPRLPGQLAEISNAVEAMRGNFRRVLGEIGRIALAIGQGELDMELDSDDFPGEYGAIIENFEHILDSLNETLGSVNVQTEHIVLNLERSSRSAREMAENARTQSALVDGMAASAAETDQQVKSNAASANAANTLIEGTALVTRDGKDKIDQMLQAMEDIRASSKDIAKIIKVIDEIAFQTNLLALNAAVEAARAGQHGRGFAVVAQEVRNLAGRSAKAARETSDLIDRASTRVQAGVRIADETSAAFASIAADIERVQSLVRDIAIASEEQTRGVSQISVAIGQVSGYSLAASMGSYEIAASTEALQVSATVLHDAVSRFRLREVEEAEPLDTPLYALPPDLLDDVRQLLATLMPSYTDHAA